LEPQGLDQARRLGEYFTGRSLGSIYSSPLQRSLQTAQVIAHRTGSGMEIESGLSEIGFGVWEGLTVQEVKARFDQMYRQWCEKPSQVVIPEGEPWDRFRERVRRSFREITKRHQEEGFKELVVVSHGGVISSLLADWLGADSDRLLRRIVLDNAGISTIEHSVDSAFILGMNSRAHLDGLGA